MSVPTELLRNPFTMYAHMRQQNPVFFHQEQGIWLVYRYAEVKAILDDHAGFINRMADGFSDVRSLSDTVNTIDQPRHTQMRALMNKAFSPRVIAEMEQSITQIAHSLIDEVVERGECDLVTDLAVPLPVRVIADMLGVPFAQREKFKLWSQHLVEATQQLVTGDTTPRPDIDASFMEMRAFFTEVYRERVKHPGPDLISRLATAEIDGVRLMEHEVVNNAMILMAAGNETTTHLIGNTILCLLENPDQFALLRQNPALIPGAVEETMRYRGAAQGIPRLAAVDREIGGHLIKAGTPVMAMIGSANRDEAVFTDPERFDVTRNPNPHLGFGHGIHYCLGAVLARLEGRIALSAVMERLQDLARVDESPLPPVPVSLNHGFLSLPVRFTPGRRRSV